MLAETMKQLFDALPGDGSTPARSAIGAVLRTLSRFMSRIERIKRKSTIATIIEPFAHLSVVIVAILALPMLPFLFIIWVHHKLRTDADSRWNELKRSGQIFRMDPLEGLSED